MKIEAAGNRIGKEHRKKLIENLALYADLAFAHLDHVVVEEGQEGNLVLFAWLKRGGLRWMRASLNRVSELVAASIPPGTFIDVVILNSAPELLDEIEAAGGLLVENDGGERRRVLESLRHPG